MDNSTIEKNTKLKKKKIKSPKFKTPPKKKIKLQTINSLGVANHLLKGRLYKIINSNLIMTKETVEELKSQNSEKIYKPIKKKIKKYPDIMTNKNPDLIKQTKSPNKFEDDYFEPEEIILKRFSKSEIKIIQNHPKFFQTHENNVLKEIREFSPKSLAEMINYEEQEKEEEKKLFNNKQNRMRKKNIFLLSANNLSNIKTNSTKVNTTEDSSKESYFSNNNKTKHTLLTNKIHKKKIKSLLNRNLNNKNLNYLDKLSKTERALNMTESNFNDKMKFFEEKRNDLRTIYIKKFHQIRRHNVKSQDYSNKNNIPYEKKYISDIIGQLIKNYSLKK